jgi:prepilin-type N-terminal cleavage/methylation domain-containing protein
MTHEKFVRAAVKGFSAIELMVVVAIAGILLAVAWARVSVLAPIYRLEGTARRVAIELQKAHGRAIAENRCYQVSFTATTYQVASLAGTSPCPTAGYPAGTAIQIDDANAITASATKNPVFRPTGRLETATGSVITFTNRVGAVRTVYTQEPSGRVYVQ